MGRAGGGGGRSGGGMRSSSRSMGSSSRSSSSRSSSSRSMSSSRSYSSSRGSYSSSRGSYSRSGYGGGSSHGRSGSLGGFNNHHVNHNNHYSRPKTHHNVNYSPIYTTITFSNSEKENVSKTNRNFGMGSANGFGSMGMGMSNGMGGFGGMSNNVSYEEKKKAERKRKITAIGAMMTLIGCFFMIMYLITAATASNTDEYLYKKPSVSYKCSARVDSHVYADTFFTNKAAVASEYHDAEQVLGFPIYLYCVDESGLSEAGARTYLKRFYNDNFDDECHVLLGYFNDLDYWEWVIGEDVEATFGEYELNNLIDSYYEYWYDDYYSNEDVFINGLNSYIDSSIITEEKINESKDIMSKLRTIANIFIAGGLVILFSEGILTAVKNAVDKKKEEEKAKEERIDKLLSQPLETFGNSEINELKDKYK